MIPILCPINNLALFLGTLEMELHFLKLSNIMALIMKIHKNSFKLNLKSKSPKQKSNSVAMNRKIGK